MNPYDVLGVSAGASDEEITKAYRRLAKQYHPDLHPGDQAAAAQMGRINQAYDEIKSMRQRGVGPDAAAGYGGPFDPFFTGRPYYTYTYRTYRPRRSPIAVMIGVLVVFFLVRLLVSLLFGGFGGYYYVDPGPGYGAPYYYQMVP